MWALILRQRWFIHIVCVSVHRENTFHGLNSSSNLSCRATSFSGSSWPYLYHFNFHYYFQFRFPLDWEFSIENTVLTGITQLKNEAGDPDKNWKKGCTDFSCVILSKTFMRQTIINNLEINRWIKTISVISVISRPTWKDETFTLA